MHFRGENIDPELSEDYRADLWTKWIELFLSLVHRKYGHFVHLPRAGGGMDQPCRTMEILKTIQREYFDFLKEVQEDK